MLRKVTTFVAVHFRPLIIAFAVASIVYPLVFRSPFALRIAILCMNFILLAISVNIVVGFMGQATMGAAAFWGIGCYTAAILTSNFHVDTIISCMAAIIVATIFSLLLSIPVMKLERHYLSIVTLGFCEILRLVELNSKKLTNGPMGIYNIPKLSFFGVKVTNSIATYYIFLIFVALITYLVVMLTNSHYGRILTSIRDDNLATQSMGVNTVKYKMLAFMIHAAIAGLAGAIYAQYVSYIDPSMFTINQSVEITVMVIFGGLGNIVGSFLGAIVLTVLPEVLRGLVDYRMMIYGLLMVVLMVVRPSGILGKTNFKYIRQKHLFEIEQNMHH